MNMSVLYFSKTGNTQKMAEVIAAGMRSVDGAAAKAFSIHDLDEIWVKDSRCIVVGSPIYMADVCGEIKTWLEGPSRQYGMAGKIGGAFATADYIHGGGELGVRTILDHMMVLGMLAFSGGGSMGKPVIHLGPVALSDHLEHSRTTFETYGRRMAQKTLEIFG